MNQKTKGILLYVGIPLLILLMIFALWSTNTNRTTEMYSEFLTKIENGEISELTLNLSTGQIDYVTVKEKDEAEAQDRSPRYSTYKVASAEVFYTDFDKIRTKNPNVVEKFDYDESNTAGVLLNLLPSALMIGVLIALGIYMSRKMGSMGVDKSMSFGKMKIKPNDSKKKTTFADVAGADEEKEELKELVDFLKDPHQFNELGARIPKGVLLVGPPGTGKTLLARAVAGEAGVPFFSISGSDFVEMFVGVGASRVRDLFEQAKKNSPAIVFIDEIDAVGRQRGAGLGGGHDEREQTLNQLLVEMDGFGANEGVIIIAATNRPDVLDKALLRPGRFDRQVTVGYPDVKGREEILKVHSRGKPLGPDVSLKTIAHSTAGFTGADLENLLNEAALLAARQHKKAITQEQIEDATIKVVMGAEKKSHVITERDKKITAYHEAGHAVVSYFLPTQDPVHQISIIPRGMAAGYTMYVPTDDDQHVSRNKLIEDICSLLGGRAAEALTQDDICTGASNDIQRATDIARKMVTKYGMSERVGPLNLGSDHEEVFLGRDFGTTKDYSEKYASIVDEEISDIVKAQYERALELLRSNMDKLHKVAQILFTEEKIDGERFTQIMEAAQA